MPHVFITCGPAYAPIDAVRRLTNLSTGEIGTELYEACCAEGLSPTLFRGEGATSSSPPPHTPFGTNASLEEAFRRARPQPNAILHAAALCDFEVERDAAEPGVGKIESRAGGLTLQLRPAPKILPRLREIFPGAVVVGWKYEVDGDLASSLAKARRQMEDSRSQACIINGPALGDAGFGFVPSVGEVTFFSDRRRLSVFLAAWLKTKI